MKKITSKLSKTPYLVILTVLIAVTVTSAYALTITLAGNTHTTGNALVDGTLTADEYFDNGNTQTGTDAIALGGADNTASGLLSTVGGGSFNTASLSFSTVGGGDSNTASGQSSTVGGGVNNIASGGGSTIGGGNANQATSISDTVGGGVQNKATGGRSTVGGGELNIASGLISTVAGGDKNTASGNLASVVGGINNVALGKNSFATGTLGQANHDGAVVFSDLNAFVFASTAANQFFVRATGGTTFVSGIDGAGAATSGAILASGSDAWAGVSDYRFKNNISEFSVLDKLDGYRAVEFDWKSSGIHDVGVIGQELEHVFPELVNSGSNDGDVTSITDSGVWSVKYSKLGALALQAVKEQQVIIDSLISIICEEHPDREICLEN